MTRDELEKMRENFESAIAIVGEGAFNVQKVGLLYCDLEFILSVRGEYYERYVQFPVDAVYETVKIISAALNPKYTVIESLKPKVLERSSPCSVLIDQEYVIRSNAKEDDDLSKKDAEIESLKLKISNLRTENTQLKAGYENLKGIHKNLLGTAKERYDKIVELERKTEELNKENKMYRSLAIKQQDESLGDDVEIETLKKNNKKLVDDMLDAALQISKLKDEVLEREVLLEKLHNTNERLFTELNFKLKENLEVVKSAPDLYRLMTIIKNQAGEISKLKEEIVKYQQDMNRYDSDVCDKNRIIDELGKDIDRYLGEIKDSRYEVYTLQQQLHEPLFIIHREMVERLKQENEQLKARILQVDPAGAFQPNRINHDER